MSLSQSTEPPAEHDYFVAELHLPTRTGTPPLPPMVIVAPGAGVVLPDLAEQTADGRRAMQSCSVGNALRAAEWLIAWALEQKPERTMAAAERGDLGRLVDRIWPIIRERAWELIAPEANGASAMLRSFIARELRARVEEEHFRTREAARLAGLHAAETVIQRLWDVACEDNPAVRAAALPALRAEVAPFLR